MWFLIFLFNLSICAESLKSLEDKRQKCAKMLEQMPSPAPYTMTPLDHALKTRILQTYLSAFDKKILQKKKECKENTEKPTTPEKIAPSQKDQKKTEVAQPKKEAKETPTKKGNSSKVASAVKEKEKAKISQPQSQQSLAKCAAKQEIKPKVNQPLTTTKKTSNTPSKITLEEVTPQPAPQPKEPKTPYTWKILDGNILKPFNTRNPTLPAPFNQSNGVTFTSTGGAPIFSPVSGTVVLIQTIYGNKLIILQHDKDLFTAIFGAHYVCVTQNDTISAGKVIGHLPQKKEALLYLEVRKNESIVDPTKWIKKWAR